MSKSIRSFQQSFAVPNPPSRPQQTILIRRNASTNPRELLLRYYQPDGLTGLRTPPNHTPAIHTPAHQPIPPSAPTNTPVRIRAHSVIPTLGNNTQARRPNSTETGSSSSTEAGPPNSANANVTQPETVQPEIEAVQAETETETKIVQSESETVQSETEDVQSDIEAVQPETETETETEPETEPEPKKKKLRLV
jgi:hypothetical protein